MYGSSFVTWDNINWGCGYLALPLTFRFFYPRERRLPLYLILGVTGCVALHDATNREKIRRVDVVGPNPISPSETDYVASWTDSQIETNLSNSTLDANTGVGVKLGKNCLEFQVAANVLGSLHNLHGYSGRSLRFVTFSLLYRLR